MGAAIVDYFIDHVCHAMVRAELSCDGLEEGTILAEATEIFDREGGYEQCANTGNVIVL
jgi:hypothetical protein